MNHAHYSSKDCDQIEQDIYKELPVFTPHKHTWVNYVNCAIEDLEEVEKYDVIFCMNVINHVNNIELAYQKLIRALKPNGKIIVSIDAHNYSFLKHFINIGMTALINCI